MYDITGNSAVNSPNNIANPIMTPGSTFNSQFKKQKSSGIPKSNFLVYFLPSASNQLPDIAQAKLVVGCETISGLESSIEEKDKTVSDSLISEKIAGKISFTDLSLKRAFDFDNFVRMAFNQRGNPGPASTAGYGTGLSDRFVFDLIIAKMMADGIQCARLIFAKECWIPKYKADDLDATSTDTWYESIDICHKGWVYGMIVGGAYQQKLSLLTASGAQILHPPIWDYFLSDPTAGTYTAYDNTNFFEVNTP